MIYLILNNLLYFDILDTKKVHKSIFCVILYIYFINYLIFNFYLFSFDIIYYLHFDKSQC
jgi:hypothetical protein